MAKTYIVMERTVIDEWPIAVCPSVEMAEKLCKELYIRQNCPDSEITLAKWPEIWKAMYEDDGIDIYTKYPEYSVSDIDRASDFYRNISHFDYYQVNLVASDQELINFINKYEYF